MIVSEDDGFLSRWSRRKVQVKAGVVPVEAVEPVEPMPVVTDAAPKLQPIPNAPVADGPVTAPVTSAPETLPPPPPPPPLTMDDVALLTPQSDYARFVAPNVDENVKRAAMKKLFTDPHYNIMDGLDTYIDDYGRPDPIPESMLRQMTQSKFLGLFDHEEEPPPPVASTHGETAPAVPQSMPEPDLSQDENADLRLQQDDAAGRPGTEPGAEPAGRG